MFCFFVHVALISFILKCYPSFCVNFLHSTVVFHHTVISANLSGVNFQYLNFMESYLISYHKVFLKNNQIYLYNTKCRRLLSHYNWTSNYFNGPESFPGHLDQMKENRYMNIRYLPLAVFIALTPVGPSKFLKQISWIQHNRVKDPSCPEANQLAIYTEAWSRI